ncbi:hypothetical protein PIB30_104337, partial [Stylosanthes scabra]|nr:hypothetical protein [Stylosanthes scabra]
DNEINWDHRFLRNKANSKSHLLQEVMVEYRNPKEFRINDLWEKEALTAVGNGLNK